MNNIFYHIYPLGLTGAPIRNESGIKQHKRLEELYPWVDHMESLGFNSLYLGPLFESSSHGYDTLDYFTLDKRLGSNEDLIKLCAYLKGKGIELYLDGVFNHVSREFFAFKDLEEKGRDSQYIHWFKDVSFDPVSCRCWEGHSELVELNLTNPEVQRYLMEAVSFWKENFQIDGLRLDVAYCLDKGFLKVLRNHTRSLDENFQLLGEVIHGDYREWLDADLLDSVTNYECYKGIYSSLNDNNYYELAYSLNRLFGPQGIYKRKLYNFTDNHDVNRIYSILENKEHFYNALLLLFTIPGSPSVYYGSEWQIEGERQEHSDRELRPCLNIEAERTVARALESEKVLKKLIDIRKNSVSLQEGDYEELYKDHNQLVFMRRSEGEISICAFNSSHEDIELEIFVPRDGEYKNLLEGESIYSSEGILRLKLWHQWGAILHYTY